jgi:hypothetical protein
MTLMPDDQQPTEFIYDLDEEGNFVDRATGKIVPPAEPFPDPGDLMPPAEP